jgi:hypothetical protein
MSKNRRRLRVTEPRSEAGSEWPNAERLGRMTPSYKDRTAVRLTESEIHLLKELMAAGEHGRIVGLAPISSAEVAHLLDLQYIKRIPGTKHYAITERGRQALAEATTRQG